MINMDISIIKKRTVYREERFRTPAESERSIGLWVDRIGMQTRTDQHDKLRQLGQYGFVLVENGKGMLFSFERDPCEIKQGDVICLFPEEAVTYNPDSCWHEKWIVFNGPEAAALESLGYLKTNLRVVPDKQGEFLAAFEALSAIMDDYGKAAILERKMIVLGLVLNIYRQSQIASEHISNVRIAQAVEFIKKNFHTSISIAELAERFSVSEPHFRTLFKEYTGLSPRKFIIILRISEAKNLLTRNNTIKQVAARVGYEDLFYFMRLFRQFVGVSPGVWRRNYLRKSPE